MTFLLMRHMTNKELLAVKRRHWRSLSFHSLDMTIFVYDFGLHYYLCIRGKVHVLSMAEQRQARTWSLMSLLSYSISIPKSWDLLFNIQFGKIINLLNCLSYLKTSDIYILNYFNRYDHSVSCITFFVSSNGQYVHINFECVVLDANSLWFSFPKNDNDRNCELLVTSEFSSGHQ